MWVGFFQVIYTNVKQVTKLQCLPSYKQAAAIRGLKPPQYKEQRIQHHYNGHAHALYRKLEQNTMAKYTMFTLHQIAKQVQPTEVQVRRAH